MKVLRLALRWEGAVRVGACIRLCGVTLLVCGLTLLLCGVTFLLCGLTLLLCGVTLLCDVTLLSAESVTV